MAYRESQASWRKLWRKEPEIRRAVLSHHARALIASLLRYADDAGCLGPVSEGKQPARTLAQMLTIQPGNRKAFYREIQELLDHGDDGEPLALINADGHYHLTRFEDCQAVRSKGRHRAVTGQSVATNAPESLGTETDLGTEDRRKTIEDRSYDPDVDSPEDPEPPSTASHSEPSSGTADPDPVLWLRGNLHEGRSALGLTLPWKPEHQGLLEAVALKASEAPGDTYKVLRSIVDAFFADSNQEKFKYAPSGLHYGFDKYAAPILEQAKAEARDRKRAEKDAEYVRIRDEYDERAWQEKQARKQEREQNGASHSNPPGGNLGHELKGWVG